MEIGSRRDRPAAGTLECCTFNRRIGESSSSDCMSPGFELPAESSLSAPAFVSAMRADWSALTDAQLLAQCEVDTYRASGPGGQKRNKTSSAVRLRHIPSGLIVIAEESRSQHENKARALRRLHRAVWLELREPAELDSVLAHPLINAVRNDEHRLIPRPKSEDYFPAAAIILDLLDSQKGAVRDTAQLLGTTSSNLIDFLSADDQVWKAVNALRSRHGQSPLRA
jgi:hypothetical protein